MFIDLSDLQVTETIGATAGTEFVRVFSSARPSERHILHRLAATSRHSQGVAALHHCRKLIEKYRFRCMLRVVAALGPAAEPTISYEDVPFRRLGSRKQDDLETLLRQAIQIVDALAEIHTSGLIHNAIRPTNVVLGPGGVTVLDFGQTTSVPMEHRGLTSPSQLEGDLRYIAPEQTGRLNRGVDYRADYYSLGAVLYEMFSGLPPFRAEDPLELVYEHLTTTPPSLHELDPTLPRFLSDVVMKLLSKDPSRRYQSAEGIHADLALALGFMRGEAAEPKEPGRLDVPYGLSVSSRLYGRAQERAALIEAYERASRGAPEMVYLSGYSGIGKTSLIRETYVPMTRQRSFFVAGKFQQLERRVPYSAWLSALGSLIDAVLTEPEAQLAAYRSRIEAALSSNAGVLTEVLPALAALLGPCPAPPPLPPREAQERFVLTFCHLVGAFCAPGRPLAVFLDDMQWADAASLGLLERVLVEPICKNVFMICAARDNELGAAHPFTLLLERVERIDDLSLRRIRLDALGQSELCELVADTFRLSATEATPLCATLAQKSGGNPFFAWQFLKLLRTKNLVRFDPERLRWTWDLAEIRALGHSENVIELMLHRLHTLPEATRVALSIGACLGDHFDLSLVAALVGRSPIDVFAALEPALAEELVIALGGPVAFGGDTTTKRLRFSHDRVQEAAHELLDPNEVPAVHHRIARLLVLGATEEQIAERAFAIADHLNAAISLCMSREDRVTHARINLLAAKRAAEAAAFEASLGYASSAMALLPDDIWSTDPELARELFRSRGEYEYLNSNFERAEFFVREAISRETDTLTKAELHHMLVVQYTLRAAYPQAIATARAGLALLSFELPEDNLVEMRDRELAKVDVLLGDRPLESLSDLPPMTDPKQLVVMKLLLAMGPPCYRSHPRLWALIVACELRLCLEHGVARGASYTFPAFGGLRQWLGKGSAEQCRGLHAATLVLLSTNATPVEASIGHLMMGSSLSHWFAPLPRASRDYMTSYSIGVESGNLQYAAYALAHDAYCKFYQGISLTKLCDQVEGYREFCKKRGNRWGMDVTEGVLRIALTLSADEPAANFAYGGEPEADYLRRCEAHHNIQVLGIYFTLKAEALLHMGRLEDAAATLERASVHLDCFATQGLLPSTQYPFLRALLLLSVPDCFGLSPRDAEKEARAIHAVLSSWAEGCPANFEVLAALVAAELAARGENMELAVDAFDRAIASALEQNMFHRAGLSAARASAWWNRRNKEHYAHVFDAKARAAYQAWQGGAGLSPSPGRPLASSPEPEKATSAWESAATKATPSTRRTPSALGRDLDMRGILRTAQAVAKSTELGEVVQAVIDNVARVSGAQRTVLLLLDQRGALRAWGIRPGKETRPDGIPLEEIEDLPRTVLQYVMRTRATLRMGGQIDIAFSRDPYLQTTKPASLVCVPILLIQELHGVLYLEHREIPDAIDEARLELIEFLAGTAAVAVRNADLVQELRSDIERTKRLERLKSEFVSTVSHELRTPLTSIRGSLSLLAGRALGELPAYAEELVTIALSNSERLARLVDDILDFERIERGDIGFRLEDLPVEQVLRRAIEGNLGDARQHAIELSLSAPEGLAGLEIIADADRMAQVMANLISNAVKFSPSGSRVVIRAMMLPHAVRIEVRDEGPGVPVSFRPRLFQPFSQADGSDSRRHDGTGLGLSITRQLVHRMGGTIGFEPIEPTGSCFYVELPRP